MFPQLTRDDVYRIETSRLWLRWPELDDAGCMVSWMGLREVATFTSTFRVGIERDELTDKLHRIRMGNAEGKSLDLAITLKGRNDVVIGMLGVQVQAGGQFELGYQLDPAHRGQGLMPESIEAVTEQVFDLTRAAMLGAAVKPGNRASIRVLEKCGFKMTGTDTYDSPIYGRFPVLTYGLRRARPSPLLSAHRRTTAGPRTEYALVGLV